MSLIFTNTDDFARLQGLRAAGLVVEALELRNEIVANNIRLAWLMTRRHGRSLDLDAAFSTACFALIIAVDTFQPGAGATFSGYACRGIRHRLWAQVARERRARSRRSEFLDESHGREDPELHDELPFLLNSLNECDREFMGRRYGLGTESLTQKEMGEQSGHCHQAIGQRERKILGSLRRLAESRKIAR
ncbi:MAG TPA: hypothetical protein VGM98_16360 [Schlesneria sp.]|jgi:RNA polymerase sigma factor (sigma-70 family)